MALSFPNIRGPFPRVKSIAAGAIAVTTLGGCMYDGGVYGASDYASGYACGNDYYSQDPYGYDDGYGYGCYDAGDYRSGFLNIGFGGGWYDDFYYPGYGTWMYDRYQVRRPLSGHYLNYWGGRRTYYRHYNNRPNHFQGRPIRPAPNYAPNRPGYRPDGVIRPDRPSGSDRPNWSGRPNRPDRPDGVTRPDRPTGSDRPNWSGRPNRPDRPDGATRPTRPTVGERPTTRPAPQVRPTPQARPEQQARPPRQSRPERTERPARDSRYGRQSDR